MQFKYKKDNPDVKKRQAECTSICEQYPDKLPIICEKDPRSKIDEISKTKYLLPNNLTVAQFSYMIRKQMKLEENEAFFLFVGERHLLTGDTLLSEVFEKYKDPDGFLYIVYANEQVWGILNENIKKLPLSLNIN